MSPSTPFIQRPVATALLMLAIVLAGPGRLPLPAAVGAAAGRLPDHPGADAVPGRQSRSHGAHRHRAARTPVRPDGRPDPHEFHQRRRRVDRHAAVWPGPDARRGRAGSAGRDQRRRLAAADRPAGAARLRQGQPGRRAGADAGDHLRHAAADRSPEPRQHAPGAEDQPGLRRGPGVAVRRPAPGRAHPGRHRRAGVVRPGPRHAAHRDHRRQCQQRQGQLRRPDALVRDQCQRPAGHGARLPEPDRRLPQRRAGAAARTWPRSSTAPKTCAWAPGPI